MLIQDSKFAFRYSKIIGQIVSNGVLKAEEHLILISNKYYLTTILNKGPYLVLLESKLTDLVC